MNGNYIRLSRKILEWEWYKNINTKILFLHCLLKANWKEGRFEGTTVPRGSFVTSVKQLSLELGLTNDEIRTALKHLLNTGELTKQTTNKYTVITVCNYDLYQSETKQIPDSPLTGTKQLPDSAQPIAELFPTIEERKKERREGITVSGDTVRQTDVQRCKEAWNQLEQYGIRKIVRLSPDSKRYQSLTARINQYGLNYVLAAIDNVSRSSFLQGGGKKGWVITFDWFVKPNNFPKVLEGNYSEVPKETPAESPDKGFSPAEEDGEPVGDDW